MSNKIFNIMNIGFAAADFSMHINKKPYMAGGNTY